MENNLVATANENAIPAQISSESVEIQAPESSVVRGRPWLPGQSGNPGGRPRTAHIREAMAAQLASEGQNSAEEIAKIPFEVARTAKNARDKLSAVEIIRDTVEGKPMQGHRLEVGMDDQTAQALTMLAAALLKSE